MEKHSRLTYCWPKTFYKNIIYGIYEINGTGTWHRPGRTDEYIYTLDHILLNANNLKELVLEGGVIDTDIPTDHRLTMIKLKTEKIKKIPTKKSIKVNVVKLDYSKLIHR